MLSIAVSDHQFRQKRGILVLGLVKPEVQIYSILVKEALFCLAPVFPDNPSLGDFSFIHFSGYFLVYKVPVA